MNLETKITIYKFTPQLFTLTQFQPVFFETESIRIPPCKADKYFSLSQSEHEEFQGQRIFGSV